MRRSVRFQYRFTGDRPASSLPLTGAHVRYREKKPLFCRVADIDERYSCSTLLRIRGETLEVVHNTAEHELAGENFAIIEKESAVKLEKNE